MKRKQMFLIFLGIVFTVWTYFSGNTSKNETHLDSLSNTEKSHVVVQVPMDDRQEPATHAKGKCKVQRPTPLKKISQIAFEFINQIKNCPCNVDYVNENNLLCATTETLETVRERSKLNFIPETLAPCVFADKFGQNYTLSSTESEEDRKFRFLHKTPSSQLLCLPSLFLLGIPKCGTTSLHASLAHHQSIRESKRKEMSFWNGGGFWEKESFKDDNSNTRYNLFAYMSLSSEISSTIYKHIGLKLQEKSTKPVHDRTLILDSSPGNFNQKPFQKLLGFIPNVKAILIMREPADRLFSYYRFSAEVPARRNSFKDQTPKGFHNYVTTLLHQNGPQAFSNGIYHVHVQRLLELIPRKDIIFIQHEEFIKDPVGVIEQNILPVVGLEPFSEDRKSMIVNNKRTNPSRFTYKMLPETKTILCDHFREYNQELSVLLNDTKWTWGY